MEKDIQTWNELTAEVARLEQENERLRGGDGCETILTGIEQRIYKKHRYSPDADYIRRILDSTVKGGASWFNQLHVDESAYNAAVEYLLSEECKADHGI